MRLVISLGVPQLIIAFVSVVFNVAVILTIIYSKELHKPIFVLFCNLAISDLLCSSSGFWIAVLFVNEPESTVDGSRALLVAYTFYAISVLATIYNLVTIGVERYLAVAQSLKMRCRVTRNQTLAVALVIWVLAAILGFMPLMGWNCLGKKWTSALYSPLCIDYLIFITAPHSVVAFILPFFTYLSIIRFLRKQKMTMGALGQSLTTYRLAEIQVVRTGIFIWLLALISYAPFFVGVIFDAVTCQNPRKLTPSVYVFRNLTAILVTMNSLGNPIVYTLKMKKLGDRLKVLKCSSNNRIEPLGICNLA
ncbi:lysophosphatidic acid receptor 1-A-like [Tiliqua scincoides]|uniref:lysophosphatidic acid receptor 1-A-like n=1 Tax=Tiliqua scincoides TaxID=71010 RepID=UPI003461C11F